MGKTHVFEVISGSYEEFLLGYKFLTKRGELAQSFTAHDHTGSVRCVAVSGHYLASGGADDRIFIYDLKTRKEHCSLTHHNATVNCIQFTKNHSHLLSGSADGVLAIVRLGNWQLEKVWEKAHKGAAILDIAVHSSGKLALTLGADCSLCTWNLVKGRQAYIINLKNKSKDAKSLEKIAWAPDDVRFVLYGGKYTEIWSIDSGGVLKHVEHKEKVTSCVWMSDTALLVGCENGEMAVVDTESDERTVYKAHDSRIKALSVYEKWVVSASSGGDIKVWDKEFEEVAKLDTGCRLTCLCAVPVIAVKKEEEAESAVVEVAESPVKSKVSRPRVVEIVEDDDQNGEELVEPVLKKKRKNTGRTGGKKKKIKESA